MKFLNAFIILLLLFFSTPLVAQQETHGDSEFWFLLLNFFEISDQWSVGNELHIRRTDFLKHDKQFILRPFLNYKLGEKVVYTIGYSYIKTQPYGRFPLPRSRPEHNFWEQVTVNQLLDKISIAHRYRMEHRYQGNLVERIAGIYGVDGFNFSHRFRYRLILRKSIGPKYFIHVLDELWITIDKKFKSAAYNQNWVYLGLGRNISNGNIQLAYLHQHAGNSHIIERHSTLQLTFQYDFH